MKTLYYFSTVKFPNARAHSIQIMNMCQAFSRSVRVKLLAGKMKRPKDEIFSFYSLEQTFELYALGPVFRGYAKFISDVIFAFRARRMIKKEQPDIVFVREPFLAFLFALLRQRFFCEIHNLSGKSAFFFKRAAPYAQGIISTNEYKRDVLVCEWGIPEHKVLVAHNGVHVALFADVSASKEALRNELHLPQDKILFGHIGRLSNKGVDKGAEFVIDSVSKLNNPHVGICFVGCTEEESERYGEYARTRGVSDQCLFLGHVPHERIPRYIHAMDFLLLIQPSSEAAMYHTSSLKSFEYMSSGVPVCVTDLPSLREFYNDTNAIFFASGNAESLFDAMRFALTHTDEVRARGARAREDARAFDWEERQRRILSFIEQQSHA